MMVTTADIIIIYPILLLIITAGIVLAVDFLFITKENNHAWARYLLRYISYAGLMLALYDIVTTYNEPSTLCFVYAIKIDVFYKFISMIILLGAALTVLVSTHFLTIQKVKQGEYYALILSSAASMMLLAAANDFITLFLSL